MLPADRLGSKQKVRTSSYKIRMCYICDMDGFPKRLQEKLARREARKSLRHLPDGDGLIDFSSNDYLGFSRNREIFERASQLLAENPIPRNGATGSRLLSGNHALYSRLEEKLSEFHQTEAALVFNSGYDANIGFFGCVPQRGDIVFYDEYIHASIRDGIKMGHAKSYKFKHNDVEDLKRKCQTEAPTLRNGSLGALKTNGEAAQRHRTACAERSRGICRHRIRFLHGW